MEVDGYTHHWSPEAKAADEARPESQLLLGGLFLLVYTWIDLRLEQRRVYQEMHRPPSADYPAWVMASTSRAPVTSLSSDSRPRSTTVRRSLPSAWEALMTLAASS